jgi:hypothetical protein
MPDDKDQDSPIDDVRPKRRRQKNDRDDEDEDDDDRNESDATGGLIPYKNPKALMAYYAGIFSFFLPVVGGVIAFVLGIMGLKYASKNPKARGQVHAGVGIGCGLLTFLFWSFMGVIIVIGILNKK